MRTFSYALLFALALVSTASAQSWKKSSWPAYGFAASFPSTPKVDTSAFDDRTMVTFDASSDKGYFAVMITEMPEFTAEALADSARRETILDGAQEMSIENAASTLRSRRPIALAGRSGREFSASNATEGVEVTTRIYLEEGRMVIQIAVFPDASSIPLVTRFLDSFAFL